MDVRIPLPAGMKLPNANTKVHWRTTWRQQQAIKECAHEIATLLRVRDMGRATCTVIIHPDVRTTRFDPANWAPAAKPAIDGAVAAGILRDDSSKYLTAVTYVAGPPVPGWRLELVFTALSAAPATT